MRALILAAVISVTLASPASAGPEVPFAERTALLSLDRKCGLFDPGLRGALAAATAQARGALLRSGWSEAQTDDLGRRAAAEGAGHACNDPRIGAAASSARNAFTAWTRLSSMRFPGGERAWTARRTPDPSGFLLRQDIPAPMPATFGVRMNQSGASVALSIPLAEGASAPSGARLYLRDRARAPKSAADLPGRTRTGLAAMAASRASARVMWATARQVEAMDKQRFAVITFPASAMAQIASLDPRESIEIEVDTRSGVARYLVEVGDVAAARAFLAAQAGA